MPSDPVFPKDFVWGAATAAPQIEGAAAVDGRGDSVWDVFCREPGRVFGGHTPGTACDFYRRWPEDVAMMQAAGLPAFRLSIAWPRVLPEGSGRVNEAGLAFYDRLIDGLLAAGIRPYATLFHWDLPEALQDRDGWANRDIAGWFADYAEVVTAKLGDRVKDWITFNEPQIFLGFGHRAGTHAPGLKLSEADVLRCAHHVNLAHGRAVAAIRANVADAKVGMAQVANVGIPADPGDPASVEAARRITLEPEWTGDASTFLGSCWWSQPMYRGAYPVSLAERHPRFLETVVREGDLAEISRPVDFHGFNYYFGRRIAADGSVVKAPPGEPRTAFGWPLHAEGLYWAARFYQEAWGLPLYIFENGLSSMDWVDVNGRVPDTMRIDFLTRYLRELRHAIGDGADVRGWFHWSWMDNFEWADGYKERFGLVHVDYETQQRTPKDSLAWLSEVIRTNGSNL
ncbi:GH1 family beta-glucosidase [Luteolibacter sp. LG18]|uniref:GH1 family beta-glucosidase n=1 Tax=Luteolibacter sp. LG18 TaxID=2819286 RepID=UPI002B280C01|nr:beta-glucosidase [Luteolibacter sp. LG18]